MVSVCHDAKEFAQRLEQTGAGIGLVDIDPQPVRMLEELEPVVNSFVHTRFVVLSAAELPTVLVFRAMQAGVRHVQSKPAIASELGEVVQRLLPAASEPRGRLVTVMTAAGGAGSTLLAVNLANELQIESSRPTLLMDLDYNYGAVGAYLDLKAEYGVAEVMTYSGGIDSQLLATTAVHCANDLHALLSPVTIDPARAEPIQVEPLLEVANAARQAYEYTVIDAPRLPMDLAPHLCNASDLVFMVFQPIVKDIRVAKKLLNLMVERGVPRSRFQAVITRANRRYQMVSLRETQEVLGDYPVNEVADDFRTAVRCINFGKTLAEMAPRSPLRRDIAALAGNILTMSAVTDGRAEQ